MKFPISLVILSVLISCGRAPEISKRDPLFTSEENQLVFLNEKADKDIVSLKYKNNILLKCDFVIDEKEGTTVSLANSYGFTVNLARNEKPINLSMKFGKHSFVVGFRVKELDILPENTISFSNGTKVIMRNTPVVKLLVRAREINGKHDVKTDREMVINEQGSETWQDLFPKKFPHILSCDLKTEIPQEYAGDLVTIYPEKTVEPSPDAESLTDDSHP